MDENVPDITVPIKKACKAMGANYLYVKKVGEDGLLPVCKSLASRYEQKSNIN